MQAKPKKVTILLPVFQGEKLVAQAIESLLNQTYEDYIIIIADDASTDNTSEICQSYCEKNKNIIYKKNKINLGGQGNFVNLLRDVKTEYVVWASQDDYWHERFLEILVRELEKDNNLSLAFSAIQLINRENQIRELNFNNKWNPNNLSEYGLIAALLLPIYKLSWLKTNLAIHGVVRTVAIKKSFDSLLGIANHDRIYILFMIFYGKWRYVEEVLYFRRTYTGSELRIKYKDKILIAQDKMFAPIISSFKMVYGTMHTTCTPLHIKLYTVIIVILYCVCSYWSKLIAYISHLIRKYGGDTLFKYLRSFYRRFKGLF